MILNFKNILIYLLILPLIGILNLLVIPAWNRTLLKQITLIFSCLIFIISLLLWIWFNKSLGNFQFVNKIFWVPNLNLNLVVGIDGISLFFFY